MNLIIVSLFTAFLLTTSCSTGSKPEAGSETKPATATPAAPAAPATAAATETRKRTDPPPKPDITCVKASDTRILKVEEVKQGCWLMYSNKGIKKRSAWSKSGNGHCEKVRDQMRSSLEKAGYRCSWS